MVVVVLLQIELLLQRQLFLIFLEVQLPIIGLAMRRMLETMVFGVVLTMCPLGLAQLQLDHLLLKYMIPDSPRRRINLAISLGPLTIQPLRLPY